MRKPINLIFSSFKAKKREPKQRKEKRKKNVREDSSVKARKNIGRRKGRRT